MRIGKRVKTSAGIVLAVAIATAPLTMLLGRGNTAQAAPPDEDLIAKAAIAEEFTAAARQAASRANTVPAVVRQSAALLKAACMEYDREPRFPRLLAEAAHQLGDEQGEIDALQAYRKINLPEVKNDEFAQVQLIDLSAAQMQNANQKLQYLKGLLGIQALSEPVRSHVAMNASDLMRLMLDEAGAKAMLAEALRLNPLNPLALQRSYEDARTGSSVDRVRALVGMLKCNPAQPAVMSALADELAAAGQFDLAVTWYGRSFDLTQQLGAQLDGGKYLDCGIAFYLMNQPLRADEIATRLLNGNPNNTAAAMLRLLVARQNAAAPGAVNPAQIIQHARDADLQALSGQLAAYHAHLNGAPANAPVAAALDPLPDITADAVTLQKMKANGLTVQQAALYDGYVAGIADLVFYNAYFDSQPAKATKLLDVLRTLKPDNDVDVAKLTGFVYLADGKRDEAKVKLSAVADRDPLAQLGMLLITPDPKAASKLITLHPSGLLGAILLDGLSGQGGKFVASPESLAVQAEAATFPEKLLDLMVRGKTELFYNLMAEPLHASCAFDDPALVRVTIKNCGDYDLALGPGGAIRSDLWFDVTTEGGNNQSFPGVTFDRIAGPLVLKAHKAQLPGTDQVVRVDVGPLTPVLWNKPLMAISLIYSVLTNPISQQSGVAPGPCGYRKPFTTAMERKAAPVGNAQQINDLLKPVTDGRVDERIHSLEQLTAYVTFLRASIQKAQAAAAPVPAAANGAEVGAGNLPQPPAPNAVPLDPKKLADSIKSMQELSDVFSATIQRGLRDPMPVVRYWAQCKQAQLADPVTRAAAAMMMVQGKDWEQRVFGLMLTDDVAPKDAKAIARMLKNDPVPWVKELADATAEVADLPPATQPATAPSPPVVGAP